ncbi:MAG: Transcription termination/antitermination protein NusA [Mycoplasmataceae bacterium]|nr:MAG: Transcription termination/antitermination protein NusA [Mycoplasmataceae bacterium]
MINNENTYDLINQLAKREEINSERIIEIITESFEQAYQKNEENPGKIQAIFDPKEKKFVAYSIFKIVEEINDPKSEILKDDLRIQESEKIVEGNAYFEINLKNLPKFIGYDVRKNIEKLILELRKERQYHNFLPLKGEIVSGYIQSIQDNFCIINLGKGLGYWDKKEWNFEDKNYLGKHLRFLLVDVKEKADLKQLILSRKGEDFVKKIFEMEIPEIKEGLVEIEKVIRISGIISKVIVKSNSFRIDPVGACIGKKGIRIKAILGEMKRERVDLVAWSESRRHMIFNLLSPVEVISLVEEENDCKVVIPEHRMSLALYGGGKIIQKIGEYLGTNIHIKSFENSDQDNDVIIWNGNINFEDYEMRKNLFNNSNNKN